MDGLPQNSIERRQSRNHGYGDQRVANGAKHLLAGTAEQRRTEGDADRIDRPDDEREHERFAADQAGGRVTDHREEVRRAEKQQDVGARDDRGDGTAEPVADDRRASGLGEAAAEAGEAADADRKPSVVLAAIAPA